MNPYASLTNFYPRRIRSGVDRNMAATATTDSEAIAGSPSPARFFLFVNRGVASRNWNASKENTAAPPVVSPSEGGGL